MAKIMLVEDDNNLREIYEARLLAEGYEIISAHDGEEALALAVREKPELIISDVMMPKISGFDMLDILRSSPETKHTKVIMMTALSQVDDKDRADRLGADRYLVKSQVTLEDVIRVANEVLNGAEPSDTLNTPQEPLAPIRGTDMPSQDQPTPTNPSIDDTAAAATPPVDTATAATPPADMQIDSGLATPPSNDPQPAADPVTQADDALAAPAPADPVTGFDSPAPASADPVSPAPTDPIAAEPTEAPSLETPAAPSPEINDAMSQVDNAQTTDAEINTVEQQIDNFINNAPTAPAELTTPQADPAADAVQPAPEATSITDLPQPDVTAPAPAEQNMAPVSEPQPAAAPAPAEAIANPEPAQAPTAPEIAPAPAAPADGNVQPAPAPEASTTPEQGQNNNPPTDPNMIAL